MQICTQCGSEFPPAVVANGIRLNFLGRKRCLTCLPHRPLRKPRKRVQRAIRTKLCESCSRPFGLRQVIDGKLRYLYRRRFCLDCSPFGSHNTSKFPPRIGVPEELREHRRRRRNAKTYRYQKKRRRRVKAELIELRGGRCEECEYSVSLAALEFHHRDPATKEFGIGNFNGSWERLLAEVEKCDLLCANCHRLRHAAVQIEPDRYIERRRHLKLRAIAYMAGACFGCSRVGPPSLFEFHHWDAREKEFGIGEDGKVRAWEKIVAELAKCVMLCTNCHREVHAGVREIDEGLAGLAEEPASYWVAA